MPFQRQKISRAGNQHEAGSKQSRRRVPPETSDDFQQTTRRYISETIELFLSLIFCVLTQDRYNTYAYLAPYPTNVKYVNIHSRDEKLKITLRTR
jgi:hypothetical protein